MRTLTLQDLEAATAGLGAHAGYVPRGVGPATALHLWQTSGLTDLHEEPGLPFDELFPDLAPNNGQASGDPTPSNPTPPPSVAISDDGAVSPLDHNPADWWSAHGGAFGA